MEGVASVSVSLLGGRSGAILTIRAGSRERAFKLINSLKYALIATNIGDVRTLVIHPASTIYLHSTEEQMHSAGVYDDSIRISIGIEDIGDLIEDFSQALDERYYARELPHKLKFGITGCQNNCLKACRTRALTEQNGKILLDPKEQLAAIKDMRSKGLVPLGNWHSHPESPSRPSEEDKRLSYDSTASYMILSLMDAEKPDLNSFHVENRRDVTREELVVI